MKNGSVQFTGANVDEVASTLELFAMPHPTQPAIVIYTFQGAINPVATAAAGQTVTVTDAGLPTGKVTVVGVPTGGGGSPVPGAGSGFSPLFPSSGVMAVNHDGTASTPRPAGAVRVFWRGSVSPVNATQWDRWIDTSAATVVEKVNTAAVGQTWQSLGGASVDQTARDGASAAQAAAALSAGQRKTGIMVPADFQDRLKALLTLAAVQLVRFAADADSVTAGYHTSKPDVKSWFAQIIKDLQTRYGDGGSGSIPASNSEAFGVGVSLSAGMINAYKANGYFPPTTGSWALGTGSSFNGPGGTFISTGTAGSSVTFTVRGSRLRLFTLSNSGGNSAWTYELDGAAPVTVNDAAGFTLQVTTVNTTPGTHTIKVTTTENKPFNWVDIEAVNATGVVGHNYARYGAPTQTFDSYTAGRGSGRWSGGQENPCDVFIYALGLNDANQGTIATGVTLSAAATVAATTLTLSGTLPPGMYRIDSEMVEIRICPTTTATLAVGLSTAHASGAAVTAIATRPEDWERSCRRAFDSAKTGNPDVILVIVMPHRGNYDDLKLYAAFVQRAMSVAMAYGAAFINVWAAGKDSWNWMDNQNFWGNSADPTQAGHDTVHLSDAGATWMAQQIAPVLNPA